MSLSSKRSLHAAEMELFIVLCTAPDKACAERIAEHLVTQRLAACVNLIPGIESVYEWQGKVERDHEVLLLIKTPPHAYAALQEAIVQLHPYETPEIIALPVETGLSSYLSWAHQAVKVT